MAVRDQPYLPLYVQDFASDEKLLMCSAEATGVYIRLMCAMHKSEAYGTFSIKEKDRASGDIVDDFARIFARFCPYDADVISRAFRELIDERVLYIDGNSLCQKRMMSDGAKSDARSSSGKKGMESRYGVGGDVCYNKTPNKTLANVITKPLTNDEICYNKTPNKTLTNSENEIEDVYVNDFNNNPGTEVYRARAREGALDADCTDDQEFDDPAYNSVGFAKVVKAFEENIHPPSPFEGERLSAMLGDVEPEIVVYGISEAVNNNARSMGYIGAVVNNCIASGIKTAAALETHTRDRLGAKRSKGRGPPQSQYMDGTNYKAI